MPRNLEFDRDRALVSAMKLFWSQGYKATSLNALLEVMGIQRSSFYASFGDKRKLFIECIQLFGQRNAALAITDDGGPEQLIRAFFEATVLNVAEERLHKGCLLVNSILELADTDEELCRLSAEQLAAVEHAFEQALWQAEQQGRWQSNMSPAEAAAFLMTLNQGLRVQSRKRLPRETLWFTLDTALTLLGLENHKETTANV